MNHNRFLFPRNNTACEKRCEMNLILTFEANYARPRGDSVIYPFLNYLKQIIPNFVLKYDEYNIIKHLKL